MRDIISGEPCNNKFNELLNKFDAIVPQEGVKDDLKAKAKWAELIKEAIQAEPLTGHQRSAILARCQNQINGTYGHSKTAANMAYGAPSSTTKNQ